MKSSVGLSKNGPFAGPIKLYYSRNSWWLATLSEEVVDQPYACWTIGLQWSSIAKLMGPSLHSTIDACTVGPRSPPGGSKVIGLSPLPIRRLGRLREKTPSQNAVPSKARLRAYQVV
jgi:hypothetical protein